MVRNLETAIPFDHHRSTPLAGIKPFVRGLQAADVDYLWLFDEFSGWFPAELWTAANTPAAALMDPNSTYDPFVVGGYAAAHAPTVGLRLTTDAVRALGAVRAEPRGDSQNHRQRSTFHGAQGIRDRRPCRNLEHARRLLRRRRELRRHHRPGTAG